MANASNWNPSIESHLEEFVSIVEAGSVSAAARELSVPRASLGRRLAKLEESFGVQLLRRETHRQSLTEAGNELYLRARKIVAELAETRSAVQAVESVPSGLLRVGLPANAGIEMQLAEAYLRVYPQVQLEFVATHTHADLRDNRIDVALRAGPIDDVTLVAKKLVSFRNVVYASPTLLEQRGVPTLDTIADWPCVLAFDTSGRPVTRWPLWDGGTVAVRSVVRTNDAESRLDGARRGLGLTLASERLARSFVSREELIPVLTEDIGSVTSVSLVWPQTEFMPPKVRAFIDLAADVLGRIVATRDKQQGDHGRPSGAE